MKRRLLNLLTALSLLLFVAVCVLWARSVTAWEQGLYQFGKRSQLVLQSHHGSLALEWYPSNNPGGWSRHWLVTPDSAGHPATARWLVTDFGFSVTGNLQQEVPPHLSVPHGFAAAAALAVAVGCAAASRRCSLRARRGLCPRCGYDLRATPGRCPECGASPAATPAARHV